jgi:hypothetical protein
MSESITNLSSGPGNIPVLLNIPVTPVYLASSNSYLRASGSCQGYQVIEFTYSSSLTSSNTVLKKCTNDTIDVNLPVQNGDKKQTFDVKIVGYLSDPGQTSNLPPNLTVIYNPPPTAVAGFGVTSGGGMLSDGATMTINVSTIGEVFTGTTTSATATARNGLEGSLEP